MNGTTVVDRGSGELVVRRGQAISGMGVQYLNLRPLVDACLATWGSEDLSTGMAFSGEQELDAWYHDCVDALNRCTVLATRTDELASRLHECAARRLYTLGLCTEDE